MAANVKKIDGYKGYLVGGIAITSWYTMNVGTVLLNKHLFLNYKFGFPLTLTTIHFLMSGVGAFIVLKVLKSVPLVSIPREDILRRLLPLAAIFCSNIVLGNVALKYIHVSFFQCIKSIVPAFTVVLQVIFLKLSFEMKIWISLIPVVGGVVLASWTEVNFNWIGFICAIISCILTAAQAVIGGFLMSQNLDPVNLLYYLGPLSLMLLLPFTLFAEAGNLIESGMLANNELLFVLILSGVVAFLLNITVFWAINATSSLTFTVAGNAKAAAAIVISVLVFGNEITALNGVGCTIAVLGVIWYGQIRYEITQKAKTAKPTAKPSVPEDVEGQPLLESPAEISERTSKQEL